MMGKWVCRQPEGLRGRDQACQALPAPAALGRAGPSSPQRPCPEALGLSLPGVGALEALQGVLVPGLRHGRLPDPLHGESISTPPVGCIPEDEGVGAWPHSEPA